MEDGRWKIFYSRLKIENAKPKMTVGSLPESTAQATEQLLPALVHFTLINDGRMTDETGETLSVP